MKASMFSLFVLAIAASAIAQQPTGPAPLSFDFGIPMAGNENQNFSFFAGFDGDRQSGPDLEQRYERLNQQAAETARRLRQRSAERIDRFLPMNLLKLQEMQLRVQSELQANDLREAQTQQPPQPGEAAPTKEQLRREVAAAFEARQQIQRNKLERLRQELVSIQQSIDTREKIKDQIIDRRVDELLNPNLRWESDGAEKTAASPIPAQPIEAEPSARITGVITGLNKGQVESLIVSLGLDDGIEPGQPLDVYRGEKRIGRIDIRSVGRDFSFAIQRTSDVPIQVGDTVLVVADDDQLGLLVPAQPILMEGVITAVDGERQLVQISVGYDDGLRRRQVFLVMRQVGDLATYIGMVEAVEVTPGRAVCRIKLTKDGHAMQIGDRVLTDGMPIPQSIEVVQSEEESSEWQKLAGAWEVVSREAPSLDSEELEKLIAERSGKGDWILIAGNHFESHLLTGDFSSGLELLDSPGPIKKLNLVIPIGEKVNELRCIYSVEGDTLLLCLPDNSSLDRPTEFAAGGSSQAMLLKFKRSNRSLLENTGQIHVQQPTTLSPKLVPTTNPLDPSTGDTESQQRR